MGPRTTRVGICTECHSTVRALSSKLLTPHMKFVPGKKKKVYCEESVVNPKNGRLERIKRSPVPGSVRPITKKEDEFLEIQRGALADNRLAARRKKS
jgi:hypothetical protein